MANALRYRLLVFFALPYAVDNPVGPAQSAAAPLLLLLFRFLPHHLRTGSRPALGELDWLFASHDAGLYRTSLSLHRGSADHYIPAKLGRLRTGKRTYSGRLSLVAGAVRIRGSRRETLQRLEPARE